jgi:hypothetical protein
MDTSAASGRPRETVEPAPFAVFRETAAVLFGLVAVTLLMTWPLATNLRRSLPSDLGDPVLNAWILGWDASRLWHGLAGVWDAPIFYPSRGTLAYSENLLGIAVLVAPVYWLTANPVLTYNVAFLISFVLAGGGMYLLTRALVGRRDAALVAALAFAFNPHRMAQLPHLQVLWSGWMPIGLWALHRSFRIRGTTGAAMARRLAALAALGAAYLLQALSNGYFLYFFLVPLIIISGMELRQLRVGGRGFVWRRRAVDSVDDADGPAVGTTRRILELLALAVIVLAALAPVAAQYFRVRTERQLVRTMGEIVHYAATPASYVSVAGSLPVLSRMLPIGQSEGELFPGVVTLVLTAVAAAAWARRRRVAEPGQGHGLNPVAVYGVVAAAAFVLSLGPEPRGWPAWLAWLAPYRWLVAIVPGLDGLRVTARIATVFVLALSVMAATGVAVLLAGRSRRAALGITAGLGAAILVEGSPFGLSVPLFNLYREYDARSAYVWLREAPPGAVLELPVTGEVGAEQTLRYQITTLVHGHPIVNGYSGYGGALQSFFTSPASPLGDPGQATALAGALSALGVGYLVHHGSLFDNEADAAAVSSAIDAAAGLVAERRRFGTITIWRLAESLLPRTESEEHGRRPILRGTLRASASDRPDRLSLAFDGRDDTRWFSGAAQTGTEWILIEFDRRRDVAEVRFMLTPDGFADYPRRLVVESLAGKGGGRVLYDGDVLTQFLRGLLADERRPWVDVVLPPNDSLALRLRQTGRTRSWYWAAQEIELLER